VSELTAKNNDLQMELKEAKLADLASQKKLAKLNRVTIESANRIKELKRELKLSKNPIIDSKLDSVECVEKREPMKENCLIACVEKQELIKENDTTVIDYPNRKKNRVKYYMDDSDDDHEWKDGLDSASSTHSDASDAIDTSELARKLNDYRQKFELSFRGLAAKISMTNFSVTNFMRNPEPWEGLHWQKKIICRKLQAWYVEHENDSPLPHVDTVEASRKIIEALNKVRVPLQDFATNNLNITKGKFEELIIKPLPWRALGNLEKSKFQLIQKWGNASSEQLAKLRSSFRRRRDAAKKIRTK
jgi:hypothetical protein